MDGVNPPPLTEPPSRRELPPHPWEQHVTRALVLMSKSPYAAIQDGETVVSRVLLEAAAESCQTQGLALTEGETRPGRISVTEVPKPPLRLGRTAAASITKRRSMIHVRFAPAALVRALESADADIIVSRRLYMAQAALDAGYPSTGSPLVAIADVLESSVLRQRRSVLSPLLALEARRTWRDELSCARGATKVVCLSQMERAFLGTALGEYPRRLDLILPPATRPARGGGPVGLFIGDLLWPPHADAATRLIALWRRIHKACPNAKLLMVGRGTERGPAADGVTRLGFVDDIAKIWDSATLLLAPVTIGGGVRVKVLDAVSRGIPVVATDAALGSTSDYLPLKPCDSDDEFVECAVRLLEQPSLRARVGGELYGANLALARAGFVERQLAECLGLSAHPVSLSASERPS